MNAEKETLPTRVILLRHMILVKKQKLCEDSMQGIPQGRVLYQGDSPDR